MDAARPALEPLHDLPVEEPVEGASPPAPGATPPAAPAPGASAESSGSASAAPPAPASGESTQTVEFINPELLLALNEAAAAPTPPPPEPPPQVLEVDPNAPLMLEDPADVEKVLTSAPPAAPAASLAPAPESGAVPALALVPDPPTLAPAPPATPPKETRTPAAAHSSSNGAAAPAASSAEPSTMVPLAKRASLSAAAVKLAAASAANPTRGAKPAKPTPPAAPAAKAASPSRAEPAVATAAPSANGASAPSLAAWANARAAATSPKTKSATPAPATRSSNGAAKPAISAPAVSGVPAAAAKASAVAASATAAPSAAAGMDRDFIARNQIVERYISGRLPIKAATDFERFCKGHPQLLDEIGLPERVNAGLRLLEASGKPEPWQENARPFWQRTEVTLGALAVALVLAIALAFVAANASSKSRRIADLQGQVHDRSLDPATSTRTVRLMPSRSGASNTPAITIGGTLEAQLVDFRIDESRSPYRDFRVTIDRIDQGRVMVLDNLTKDSNGHLRIALNSSALGPGNYQLTIEGLTQRLDPQPDSWVTIGVAARAVAQ